MKIISADGVTRWRDRTRRERLHAFANDFRLTTASGEPVPTSSNSSWPTLYLSPYKGNRIEVYEGVRRGWQVRTSAEISLTVPSTLFRLADVFVRWNGRALEMKTVNWNQSTGSITSATAATPSVITSAGHGLSNGDLVGLDGLNNTVGTDATNGLNDTVWTVANKTADTFEVEGSQCASLVASTSGNWYSVPNTRTALGTQDSRLVQDGDEQWLYVGTVMTTGTSGRTDQNFGSSDSPASWLLWNYYHREPVKLFYSDSTNNWSYQTDAFRPANGRGKLARLGFVIGVSEDPVEAHAYGGATDDGATPQNSIHSVGIGLDGFTTNDATQPASALGSPYLIPIRPYYGDYPGVGFHYLGWTENSDGNSGGTTTWYGQGGVSTKFKAGIRATILA